MEAEQSKNNPISMGLAFVIWLGLLLLFVLTLFARWQLAPIVWVGAGIYLNRTVLRGLIGWHPIYDTLDNVAGEKFKMLLLWPLAYPTLFIKLLVAKHL